MRQRLQDAVNQRDAVTAANDRLLGADERRQREAERARAGTDFAETLKRSRARSPRLWPRGTRRARSGTALTQQVADLELRLKVNGRRQDEMVDQLEQAVALSFGPLEKLIKTADLDVDSLIAAVQQRLFRPGRAGPATRRGGAPGPSTIPALNSRFDKLMLDLDRMDA